MLCHLAGAFAREPFVVTVDRLEARRQRLVVCVADQVQADVDPVFHALEYSGQLLDRVGWNLCHTRLELNRRDEIAQFDGL